MNIDILTLFPEMFKEVFHSSIIARSQKKGLVKIKLHNLRQWSRDKHQTVDDKPYGGGAGMLMKVEVIDRAIASLKRKTKNEKLRTILLTPQGKTFNQPKAKTLSSYSNLLLICGHYEGFDERIRKLVDEEISIGNYILTGGEIPAMIIVDAVIRLIPGVLGKNESSQEDSFSMEKFVENVLDNKNLKLKIKNCLEYPQYTRPKIYQPVSKKYQKPLKVPKILLSGNHGQIKKWRLEKALKRFSS